MFPLNHGAWWTKVKGNHREGALGDPVSGRGRQLSWKGKKNRLKLKQKHGVGCAGAPAPLWHVPLNLNGTFRHLPVTVNLLLFHPPSPRDDQSLSSRLQGLFFFFFLLFHPCVQTDILPGTISTARNLYNVTGITNVWLRSCFEMWGPHSAPPSPPSHKALLDPFHSFIMWDSEQMS